MVVSYYNTFELYRSVITKHGRVRVRVRVRVRQGRSGQDSVGRGNEGR